MTDPLEPLKELATKWRGEYNTFPTNGASDYRQRCADELESLLPALEEAFAQVKQQREDVYEDYQDAVKRLNTALAQVEIVDRSLGDPGNTSSKAALDAHDAEVRDRALEEAAVAAESMPARIGHAYGYADDAAKVIRALRGSK